MLKWKCYSRTIACVVVEVEKIWYSNDEKNVCVRITILKNHNPYDQNWIMRNEQSFGF